MATFNLFGWEFVRKKEKEQLQSFTPKEQNDGALVIAAGSGYGTYVDLDGTVRTEAELVTKYREMSLHPECDSAIDEIINESISVDEDEIITINLDSCTKLSEKMKKSITDEFNICLRLLDFSHHAYDIYRRWYVDGRLYYHILIDKDKPRDGIKELRYVDPRKIRKVREIVKKRADVQNPVESVLTKVVNEYFIYNDKGFNYGNKVVGPNTTGLRIARDSMLHIVSGLTDNQGTMVLSYLHKAIKALNQLRTLEDALVIYRLSRAPERRIWYIDVGNLPKMKAEQYVRDIMVKHKNRLIYDASSGEIRDDRKFMTMLEDYWLPRREGGKGTEVITLPGGQTLGQMDDVLYFQKKFLNALNVPISRLNSDALFSVGRATEITRDELKFSKFVVRMRCNFSKLFYEILKKQVVLKGIMSIEAFEILQPDIKFYYAKDNYFTELKDAEINQNRINLARGFQDMAGKYFPHLWIRKNVLMQTDEEIKQYDEEMEAEADTGDPRWINPQVLQNEQMANMLTQENMSAMQNLQQMQMGGGPPGMAPPGQEGMAGGMPPQGGMPPPGMAEPPPPDSEAEKLDRLRKATQTVKHHKSRPKENRTMQDEAQFKSASQILARNKDYLKQRGI